jgi:hypothetical protein
VGAATTPVPGTSTHTDVRWHTYFRDEDEAIDLQFDPAMFAETIANHSLVARAVAERENPYLSRMAKVNPNPAAKVSMLPAGSATVRLADDGGAVLADLGVLTASEAGRIADTVNASGAAVVTVVALGVM